MSYLDVLKENRLIAILRGISPHEVLDIVNILVKSGIKIIEIPLNSPEVYKSIRMLTTKYKDFDDIFIGAGTVCSSEDVEKLKDINATLIISPNSDANVIKKTKKLGLISIPGFLTPSEAYNAINAGADCLKLFPFKRFGLSYFNDIKVIIPKNIPIIAVGGVDESNIEEYMQNGIMYFGLGSSLYKPNMDLKLLKTKAEFFVKVINENKS